MNDRRSARRCVSRSRPHPKRQHGTIPAVLLQTALEQMLALRTALGVVRMTSLDPLVGECFLDESLTIPEIAFAVILLVIIVRVFVWAWR